jgi:drug/metabolite transporter (DMT)-like permease
MGKSPPLAPRERALDGVPIEHVSFTEQHVSSVLTGMLNGAVPLFTAIVAAGLARRWPSRGIASGLAVGLAGGILMAWRAQAVALVLTAPLGLPEVLRARWSPGPLFSLLALGALGTGVAYVLTVMAAGRVGATKASATAFLIPPVALLLGVLVRGERVAGLSVIGGVVCLAGA